MQVTRIFRYSFAIVFLLCSVCRTSEGSAQPDNIAGIAPAASGVAKQEPKSMLSLLNADKLDASVAVAGEAGVAADSEQEASGARQTRQVIYPYGGYGRYYGGYPYYSPYYSYYTYRPYYYSRPIYSYGLPFYFYG
uniref:50S ribosomal protein L9 n=1 Tax=Zeugodacus cucurbitae TaxID=28588 RepID=A0A0A1XLJ4_ZEUCU